MTLANWIHPLLFRGGDAWTPASIPGCVFWHDPVQLAGYGEGDPVDVLVDYSGLGNDGLPDTAPQRAIYRAAFQNGLPALQYNWAVKTQYKLPAGLFVGAPTLTWFVVSHATFPGASTVAVSVSQGGPNYLLLILPNNWGAANPTFQYGKVHTDGAGGVAAWYVATAKADATKTGRVYRNGVLVGVPATDLTVNIPNIPVRIGGLWNFAENNQLHGHLAEVILYNPIISDADIAIVEAYLMTKWGIA